MRLRSAALPRSETGGTGLRTIRSERGAGTQELRVLRAEAGRAEEPFEVTVGHRGGPLDARVLSRYADAGVDRVAVLPWTRGREAIEKLEQLARALGSAGLASSD